MEGPPKVDLEGRTILVTGATSGIGFHTALGLASRGARVFVTGRDAGRGADAVEALRRAAGHDAIEFLAADAASVRENHALASRMVREVGRLDVLVNNAGALPSARRVTDERCEASLAANFVGPYALTDRLLPLLRSSVPARVVNVVSSAFQMWKGDPFEDLQSERDYVGIRAHARAKLLNLLWTFALARRLEGTGVTVNATNPGMAWTPGTRALTPEAVPAWRLIWPVVRWFQRRASAAVAARSSIFLAASPDVADLSGAYFDEMRRKSPSIDLVLQERAWETGATLVAHALEAGAPRAPIPALLR
jgi:NAD(P)-dependent dehydrogenase (short-subunit alcohol dehydrogenase family)